MRLSSGSPAPDPPRRSGGAGATVRSAVSLSLAVLPAMLALAACGSGTGSEGGATPATEVGVEAAVARRDTVALTVRSVGSLEADARIRVRPEIDAHVTSIHFREGEPVDEGELLVRLDQNKLKARVEAARATVASARAEVENLERRLERNDTLLAQGAISQQAYDDLETRLNTARARLQEARANLQLADQELEDATIRAPFAGRTGSRTFDVGDYVQVGEELFTLVDDDPMEIRFTLPERYLGSLHRGSPVELTVRSMPGRTYRGKVDFVSPYVDPTNRTVELKARVPNPESELRAGQFADVRLELESRPTVLVPEAAVVPRQSGNVVFRIRGGKAVRTSVDLGARQAGEVEVTSGVPPGDTVVVAGQQNLSDGTAVSVRLAGETRPDRRAAAPGSTGPPGGESAAGPDTTGSSGAPAAGTGRDGPGSGAAGG